MNNHVLIAISGGMDSMLAASLLKSSGRTCMGIHIDLGGPAATAQRSAAETFCRHSGIPLEIVEFRPSYTIPSTNFQTDGLGFICLLGMAAALACSVGLQHIALGLTSEQMCDTHAWLDLWQQSASAASHARQISVEIPIAGFTKAQVVQRYRLLGLHSSQSWSCTTRSDISCRTCDACLLRERAQ